MRGELAFCAAVVGAVLTSGLAFGQADWSKRTPAHAPIKRMFPAMAQIGPCSASSCGPAVLLFGGLNLGAPNVFSEFHILNDTWLWDGNDWTQFTPTTAPAARYGASMSYDPVTGNAVMFGGEDANGNFFGDTWIATRHNNCTRTGCTISVTWKQVTGASPGARGEASMIFGAGSTGRVVLTGGVTRSGLTTKYLNDTWIFNTSTSTWAQQSGSNPPPRSEAPMADCFGSGQATDIMFGGFNGSFTGPLGDTWVFNLDLPEWFGPNVPQTQPAARFGHGLAAYPVSGFEVMYGGQAINTSGATFLPTDTWNADCNPAPNTWSAPAGKLTPAHNPGSRMFHGMTTGPNGLTVVLFGGNDLTLPRNDQFHNGRDHNDTWTWGRNVACLPVDGSQVAAGDTVSCQYEPTQGLQFSGWSTVGFMPASKQKSFGTFQAKTPGAGTITAEWTDAGGSHSQTFTYTITQ